MQSDMYLNSTQIAVQCLFYGLASLSILWGEGRIQDLGAFEFVCLYVWNVSKCLSQFFLWVCLFFIK